MAHAVILWMAGLRPPDSSFSPCSSDRKIVADIGFVWISGVPNNPRPGLLDRNPNGVAGEPGSPLALHTPNRKIHGGLELLDSGGPNSDNSPDSGPARSMSRSGRSLSCRRAQFTSNMGFHISDSGTPKSGQPMCLASLQG